MLLGWVQYFGRFHRSALRVALRTLDSFIVRWAQRKYKRPERVNDNETAGLII
jgi:hypothetical protein